jgi:hypothetical protein
MPALARRSRRVGLGTLDAELDHFHQHLRPHLSQLIPGRKRENVANEEGPFRRPLQPCNYILDSLRRDLVSAIAPIAPAFETAMATSGLLTMAVNSETSVLVPQAVAEPTERAPCRCLRIIHTMPDGLECAQVGEYVLEITIGQTAVRPPGHD